MNTVEQIATESGLTTVTTGGGCMALIMYFGGAGYALITDADGMGIPESPSETCMVGFYLDNGPEDEEHEEYVDANNLSHAIEMVKVKAGEVM